ncbi:hypothetical protein BGW41_003537 [Actinomortierella wolfii]|nr:hypothetical protein BGW41_003537 [Actinomortierella wolfii]
MSASLPAFQRPCLAAGGAGLSTVYLAGVSSSILGRLELYKVNINNIQTPSATLIGAVTNATTWFASADRYCDTYSGDRAMPSGPPILIQQFGERTSATAMFFANGTLIDQYPNNSKKISYKLFAPTGATGNYNWYTTMSNRADNSTLSPWMSLQYYYSPVAGGTFDYLLGNYPSTNALLAVGTFQPSAVSPAAGYVSVFEKTSGIVYTASSLIKFDDLNRVQTLSSPYNIKMNGIVLTSDAFPVSLGNTGYIVDRATADDSTVLYSITPSSGVFELRPVAVSGNVPPFLKYRGATGLGTQLIFYGGLLNGSPSTAFHLYDTISNQWSGPDLVKPLDPYPGNGSGDNSDGYSNGGKGTSNNNGGRTGAIVGGILGAVVVLALLAFIWFRRRKHDDDDDDDDKGIAGGSGGKGSGSGGKAPHSNLAVVTAPSLVNVQSQDSHYHKVPPTDMPYPPYQTAYPPVAATPPPASHIIGQPQQQQQQQQAEPYYRPPQFIPQHAQAHQQQIGIPVSTLYDPCNNASFTQYSAAAGPLNTTPTPANTMYQPQPQIFSPVPAPAPSAPQQPHTYLPPTLATTINTAVSPSSSAPTTAIPTTPVDATPNSGPLSPMLSHAAYSPTNTSSSSSAVFPQSTTPPPLAQSYHPVVTSSVTTGPNNPQYIPPTN